MLFQAEREKYYKEIFGKKILSKTSKNITHTNKVKLKKEIDEITV